MRNVTMIYVCKQHGRRRTVECYWAFKVPNPRKCARAGRRVGVKGVPRKK